MTSQQTQQWIAVDKAAVTLARTIEATGESLSYITIASALILTILAVPLLIVGVGLCCVWGEFALAFVVSALFAGAVILVGMSS